MNSDPFLSRRASAVPPPPEHARLSAPGIIAFGGGLPDVATYPADLLAELADTASSRQADFGYGYEAGHPALRRALAERMARSDGAPTPEGIVLTNGSSGALDLAALATIDPGDVVLVEELTYPMAVKLFRLLGATVHPLALTAAGLDVDACARDVDALVRSGRKVKLLYTIATCQSPTGTVLPADQRLALADIARRHDFLILQDDTYGEIRYERDLPDPLIAFAPERTIHVGSFSKTIAPGLRIGWAAASEPIARALLRVRTDLGNSPILQRAIASMIESGRYDAHLATVTTHYRSKRDRLDALLHHHCEGHGSWAVPAGGFLLWFRPYTNRLDTIVERAAAAGLAFLPGSYFDAREAGACEERALGIRLAFGQIGMTDMDVGIERLEQVLAGSAG